MRGDRLVGQGGTDHRGGADRTIGPGDQTVATMLGSEVEGRGRPGSTAGPTSHGRGQHSSLGRKTNRQFTAPVAARASSSGAAERPGGCARRWPPSPQRPRPRPRARGQNQRLTNPGGSRFNRNHRVRIQPGLTRSSFASAIHAEGRTSNLLEIVRSQTQHCRTAPAVGIVVDDTANARSLRWPWGSTYIPARGERGARIAARPHQILRIGQPHDRIRPESPPSAVGCRFQGISG